VLRVGAQGDLAARERILRATVEILTEGVVGETITVRQIAGRARVGVGAINYHFESKGHLLNEAVLVTMREVANGWLEPLANHEVEPVARLRRMIKETARIAAANPELSRISIRHDLLQGDLTTPSLLLPVLREIFGRAADETSLRLIAFQLIASTQVAFLRAGVFGSYAGVDLLDDRQRDACIDALIDQLIGAGPRPEGSP
jgi:AcrR family transcriptional regulator